MDKLVEDSKQRTSDYNSEPVHYCTHCLSLAIRTVDGTDFCDKCGGTDIKEANIFDWEEMWLQKYGEKYLTNN